MFFENIVSQEEFAREFTSEAESNPLNKYIFMVQGQYILQENASQYITDILKNREGSRKVSETEPSLEQPGDQLPQTGKQIPKK